MRLVDVSLTISGNNDLKAEVPSVAREILETLILNFEEKIRFLKKKQSNFVKKRFEKFFFVLLLACPPPPQNISANLVQLFGQP